MLYLRLLLHLQDMKALRVKHYFFHGFSIVLLVSVICGFSDSQCRETIELKTNLNSLENYLEEMLPENCHQICKEKGVVIVMLMTHLNNMYPVCIFDFFTKTDLIKKLIQSQKTPFELCKRYYSLTFLYPYIKTNKAVLVTLDYDITELDPLYIGENDDIQRVKEFVYWLENKNNHSNLKYMWVSEQNNKTLKTFELLRNKIYCKKMVEREIPLPVSQSDCNQI